MAVTTKKSAVLSAIAASLKLRRPPPRRMPVQDSAFCPHPSWYHHVCKKGTKATVPTTFTTVMTTRPQQLLQQELAIYQEPPAPPQNHASQQPAAPIKDEQPVEEEEEEEEEEARGHWSKGIEFFLSLVGYAVGIGNIWRFPYVCIKNGGGAFLIPFFLFLFICGMPLFLLELILGQFSNLSPITLWNICPLFKGIGLGMVIVSAIVCVYFNVIMAWSLFYLYMSFRSKLPWMGCDNPWNTPKCIDAYAVKPENETTTPQPVVVVGNLTNATYSSTEEFWRNYILGQTNSPDDFGDINYALLGCLVLAWIGVFLCMFKGVQSSGKVVYVTAVAPYIFLVILIIRGVTLPGAADGLIFFLKPDFAKLLDYQVWIDACLQIFFSLGPAWGGLITMASFNKFNYNCYRDAFCVSVIDAGTCFLGGLVIFSVLGNMAYNTGAKVEDFNRAGPGLAFVVYPAALSQLPFPQVWAVLFFGMLLTLGIDTQFGMFETVVSGVLDQFRSLRRHKTIVIALLAVVEFLLGIPFVTGAGYYFFQILNHYAAALSVTLMALLECVVVSYIYGIERLYSDMDLMFHKKPANAWKYFWLYVTPFLLLVIVLGGLTQLDEPTFLAIIEHKAPQIVASIDGGNTTVDYPVYVQEEFFYPRWLIAVGWLCALSSLVVIPLLGLIALGREEGPFVERVKKLCRTTEYWVPSPPEMRAEYLAKYSNYVEMRKRGTACRHAAPTVVEAETLMTTRKIALSIEVSPPADAGTRPLAVSSSSTTGYATNNSNVTEEHYTNPRSTFHV